MFQNLAFLFVIFMKSNAKIQYNFFLFALYTYTYIFGYEPMIQKNNSAQSMLNEISTVQHITAMHRNVKLTSL